MTTDDTKENEILQLKSKDPADESVLQNDTKEVKLIEEEQNVQDDRK